MGIYLNPGNDNFKMALRSKIYVDKTELIKYTNGVMDTEMRYLCVSRPRRFGKSMAANMLCAYYGRGWDSLSLFQDRKIGSEETFQEHLNQYDVIFLNIQQFLRGAKELAKLERIYLYHRRVGLYLSGSKGPEWGTKGVPGSFAGSFKRPGLCKVGLYDGDTAY